MAGTVGQGGSDEKRREIPYLGAVKIAAVVMGIMIVVGIAVIGVTIAKRLGGAGEEPPAAAATALPGVTVFGDVSVSLPAGSKLRSMSLDGRLLALQLVLEEGTAAVLMIDTATGDRLGLIRLPVGAP